ncbi:MAG: hypothetical protein EZS28_024644, partial [Streblomastix strix]
MPRTILKGLQARIEAQKFLKMECVSQFDDEIEAAANLIEFWKIPRGLFVELFNLVVSSPCLASSVDAACLNEYAVAPRIPISRKREFSQRLIRRLSAGYPSGYQ